MVEGKTISFTLKWLFTISVSLILTTSFAQESLTIISNIKGAPADMKMSELKSIMRGEKQRWADGSKVNIFLMKTTTPVGQLTCQKVYNMSTDRVKRFWLELTFGGQAEAPTFCNTMEELESLVSQSPGAIGIIDKAKEVPETKITRIDSKDSF
jgi:ABC-type phosphate transport system substrate-binding protein